MRPIHRPASPPSPPRPPAVAAADMLRVLDETTATLPAGSWARWLAAELREDLHARLDHVGRTPETAILLTQVFTDIAASVFFTWDEEGDDEVMRPRTHHKSASDGDVRGDATPFGRGLGTGVLTALLGVHPAVPDRKRGLANLAQKLAQAPSWTADAPQAQIEHYLPKSASGADRPWRFSSFNWSNFLLAHNHEEATGYLLVGGPGQGKSTLSQFLCQLHRAAILPAQAALLDDTPRNALRAFEESAVALELSRPADACLPIRIVLRDFAAWMFREKQPSERALAAFVALRMTRALRSEVSAESVLAAITTVPWLLVLDGLDEVPTSSGRPEMLKAIRAFLGCREASLSPRIVVATTRPQGYAGELGDFAPLYLVGLSRSRMKAFATRLVNARYPGNPDRQSEILDRLDAAWDETGRNLLRTPLQVTLMADLAAQVGRIPGDRWKLFADYYRVMYMRETARPNLQQATLLDRLKSQITQLHHRAGLWLQIRSDQSGGTDALLSREELAGLVNAVLADDYEEPERGVLVEQVLQAAVERLVFLVQTRDGKYGFEIRSLQEWMAAEALLNGSDEDVKARLKQVAPFEAWGNVVLFAAGKCFTELFALADFLVDLCAWMNDGCEIPEARATLLGSELALDILEDGAAREQRGRARKLAAIALRLLELPPAPVHERLARSGDREFEEALRRALDARILEKDHTKTLGAWRVLGALMDAGVAWARALADRAWPSEGEARRAVVLALRTTPGERVPDFVLSQGDEAESRMDVWLLARIEASLGDFSPAFLKRIYSKLRVQRGPAFCSFLSYLGWYYEGIERALGVSHEGRDTGIRGAFWRLCDVKWEPDGIAEYSMESAGAWAPVIAAARLLKNPTVEQFATILHSLADILVGEVPKDHAYTLPWPIAQALEQSSTPEDLSRLADRLAAGEYGSGDALGQAEKRLEGQNPVDVYDLLDIRGFWPAPGADGFRFPLQATFFFRTGPQGPFTPLLPPALDAFRKSTGERRYAGAWLIRELLHKIDEDETERTSGEVRAIISSADAMQVMERLATPIRVLPLLPDALEDVIAQGWADVFDMIGTRWPTKQDRELGPSALINVYTAQPEKTGLLRLLALSLNLTDVLVVVPVALIAPTRFAAGSLDSFCAALIRLKQHNLNHEEEEAVATAMAAAWPPSGPFTDAAFETIAHAPPSFLLSLLSKLGSKSWEAAAACLEALRLHREPAGTALADAATCARLRLPAPPPPARSPSDRAPATGVFHFHSISFAGLRPFRNLAVSFPSPSASEESSDTTGQWMILIGENGVGKSTLLRGLVFALGDPSAATGALAKSPAPYRREGNSSAEITVVSATGSFTATIAADPASGRETLHFGRKNGGRRPFLVAYGCQRGSALGGPNQETSFASESDIVTLFDETRGLLHAEMWLTRLWVGAKNDAGGPGAARFETVIDVLKRVLSLDTIDVQEDGVWVTGRGTERARLAALSDGYLTTAGWVVDLMARWIDRAKRLGQDVPPRFNESMEGLVLVDEVDLHLHPRWQLRILTDLRGLFPRLSFVVTTHHSLTLLGTRKGEIFVLVRDDKTQDVEARPLDLPLGLRADQVLTGEWFGLASTLDPDTLGLLDRHRQMLRRGVPEDDPERRDLEATLRERLGSFQETAMDRLVQSVAAELVDETYTEPTAEERAELRERIKRRARERLSRAQKPATGGAE